MAEQDLELLLDDLLVEYLSELNHYQAAQDELQASLKAAYFDLSRSKLALGPAKMSQDSYDLSERWSNIAVSITSRVETETEVKRVERADEPVVVERPTYSFNLGVAAPPPPSSILIDETAEKTTSSTLRSRTSSKPAITISAAKSTTGDNEKRQRPSQRSPLLQFSAFPPPALRQAQSSWSRVLQNSVDLAESKTKVEERERKVRDCRARIDRSKNTGQGES